MKSLIIFARNCTSATACSSAHFFNLFGDDSNVFFNSAICICPFNANCIIMYNNSFRFRKRPLLLYQLWPNNFKRISYGRVNGTFSVDKLCPSFIVLPVSLVSSDRYKTSLEEEALSTTHCSFQHFHYFL